MKTTVNEEWLRKFTENSINEDDLSGLVGRPPKKNEILLKIINKMRKIYDRLL